MNSTLLSENLRRRREELGFSLNGLAYHAGMDSRYLEELEKGCIDPRAVSMPVLYRLARSLETDLPTLLEAAPVPATAPVITAVNNPVPTRRFGVIRGGRHYAALVCGPDWPLRLVRATRIELLLALAARDGFGVEMWSRALTVVSNPAAFARKPDAAVAVDERRAA